MLENIILLAATPDVAEGANLVSNIAGKFGVDWKLLIAQIINFLLVIFLLHRFAFKPVLRTLAARQEKIAKGLQYTEEMEQKLKEAEKIYSDKMKQAEHEAKVLIDAAREQAKNYTEHQAQEAIAKAEHMIKKAEEAIEQERKQMLSDVRKDLASLVVTTSSKVLSKTLSDEDQKRFSESAVAELSLN